MNDEKCSGFLSKKKVQVKNEVTRNLSSPIVEIFNGYEMIGQDLARNERVDIDPTNIVYEPVFDEHIPVPCFFSQTKLTWLIEAILAGLIKEKNAFVTVLLNNVITVNFFFAKTDDAMKKYLSICAAREGITYALDNGQIINFQNNFKYLADVLLVFISI